MCFLLLAIMLSHSLVMRALRRRGNTSLIACVVTLAGIQPTIHSIRCKHANNIIFIVSRQQNMWTITFWFVLFWGIIRALPSSIIVLQYNIIIYVSKHFLRVLLIYNYPVISCRKITWISNLVCTTRLWNILHHISYSAKDWKDKQC